MTPDATPLSAARRSILEGRALPRSAKAEAVALGFATRFVLRGGPEVAAAVAPAFGVAPPLEPLRAAADGARAALWMGPDEWLLIAEEASQALGERLEAALAGAPHALVDVSHRQCAIEIDGLGAVRLLAAGVPLDLDLAAFPVGMVARTLLLKAEITLWRREAARFHVEVGRSFAPYVAAILDVSARDQEFG